MTKAEELLWKHLSNRQLFNIKFRRQHPINKYVADFYSHEIKLIIEIDGSFHQESFQRIGDVNRSYVLSKYGIDELRFTNAEVLGNIEVVLESIKARILYLKRFKEV